VTYSSAFTTGAAVTVQLHGTGQNFGGVTDKSVFIDLTGSTTAGFTFQIVNEAGVAYPITAPTTLKVDYIAIAPN
jgi:hypothetical protein